MQRILITGGAGFVGSNLASYFKQHYSDLEVVALDNLMRRGSELNLPRLKKHDVKFVHGDVRLKDDLLGVGKVDLILDCAAEPSVLAGLDGSEGSLSYVVETNLNGTLHCLELARRHSAKLVFLSTSRIYPVEALNQIQVEETETRFEISSTQTLTGITPKGIAENFPLEGVRTLYGASKLSSEYFIQEYVESFGLEAVINRCGVLSGPWQMGKVDQGVVVLWLAKHFYSKSLSYIGFGGAGKQVRDMLHIEDLFELIKIQLGSGPLKGEIYNVGGGRDVSFSLQELTAFSQELTGIQIPVSSNPETRPGDIKLYLTDNTKVSSKFNWSPKHGTKRTLTDIFSWLHDNQVALEPILA